MDRIIIALLVFVSTVAWSAPLKVLNFNTMCHLCGKKKEWGPFKERLRNVADTAKRHTPDLISFQELSSRSNINKLSRHLGGEYEVHYAKGLLSWADPALFIRKSRFQVLQKGGAWLGPNPKFPLGWKLAIPRRFQWVKLRDKQDGSELVFVGTHFDNHSPNKEPSARVIRDWISKWNIPVIFAGDTNLHLGHPGYPMLVNQGMRNAFDEASSVQILANAPYDQYDPCPDGHRGDGYPSCRIDHVLLSPNAPWKAKSFTTDLIRYRNKKTFVSDHRAVVVELE